MGTAKANRQEATFPSKDHCFGCSVSLSNCGRCHGISTNWLDRYELKCTKLGVDLKLRPMDLQIVVIGTAFLRYIEMFIFEYC